MIISKEEMQRRLNSSKNLANKLNPQSTNSKIVELDKQAGQNPPLKDEKKRTLIGTLARQGENINQIARDFNVTPQQVKSARDTKVPAVAIPREKAVENIRDLALDKLMMSLGLLDLDRISMANPNDIAGIAEKMSRIYDKLGPKVAQANNTQLIIYAPQIRSESSFKTLDV